MNLVLDYFHELRVATVSGWNRFWFTAVDPATLCLIRVLAGAMMFYTHLVWSLELEAFFGPDGWISPRALAAWGQNPYGWSYFFWIQSPGMLWAAHIAALVVFALLTVGLFSRAMSVLAFAITLSYAHRAPLALFGLDIVNETLAMYLIIGPCGAAYSVDRWLKTRRGRAGQGTSSETVLGPDPSGRSPQTFPSFSVAANIAIRLIQVHMCIIYLFSALGKLMGQTWWNGLAMWYTVGNLEYQTIDVTFLVDWPVFLSLLGHVTVAWELSYIVLIWPRLTRPIILAIAVPLHLGIACFLGMVTFGLAMLIANLAFVSPALVRTLVDVCCRRRL